MNNVESKKRIDTEANSAGYNFIILVYGILAAVAAIQKLMTGKEFADFFLLCSVALVGGVGESYVRYKANKSKSYMVLMIISAVAAIVCLGSVLYEGFILK